MWEILRVHRATSLCILSRKSTERTGDRSCRACRCTRTCRRLRSEAIPAASCCPLLLRSITRIKHRETKYNFRCATRPSDRVRCDRSVYARGTEKPAQSPCSTSRKSGCCTRPPRTPRPRIPARTAGRTAGFTERGARRRQVPKLRHFAFLQTRRKLTCARKEQVQGGHERRGHSQVHALGLRTQRHFRRNLRERRALDRASRAGVSIINDGGRELPATRHSPPSA